MGFIGIYWSYPLVMTNRASHGKWSIEIDGLPNLKMGGFSMAMLNNQMVRFNKGE